MRWVIPVVILVSSSQSLASETMVCRKARAPDVEGAVCAESFGVIQPCKGVVVRGQDLIDCEADRASLDECRKLSDISLAECHALRASDAAGAEERESILAKQVKDANGRADAHFAELIEVRGMISSGPSTARIILSAAIIAVGVAAMVTCASGDNDSACFVSGASAGVGISLLAF